MGAEFQLDRVGDEVTVFVLTVVADHFAEKAFADTEPDFVHDIP